MSLESKRGRETSIPTLAVTDNLPVFEFFNFMHASRQLVQWDVSRSLNVPSASFPRGADIQQKNFVFTLEFCHDGRSIIMRDRSLYQELPHVKDSDQEKCRIEENL